MAATKPALEKIRPASSWGTLGWLVREAVPHARFVKYSCSNCFRWLWSTLENKNSRPASCSCWLDEMNGIAMPASEATAGTQRPGVLVIAYDGSPDSYARPAEFPHLHLDKVFSPASLYSLLAAQRLSQEGGDIVESGFDYWLIIDPNHRIDSFSEKIARLLHPLIQIIDGGTSLFSTLDQLWTKQSLDESKLQTALESLKRLFIDNDNRHAVTNVIGPLLLGIKPADEDLQSVVSYINQVLHILKLGSPTTTAVLEPTPSERKRLRDSGPLNFTLVDDQVSDGWDQVVATALGFDCQRKQSYANGTRFVSQEQLKLSTYDSAEFILKRLEQAVDRQDESSPLRMQQTESVKEVLLLDLRLFEGRELLDEAKFLSRVLKCAERFCEKTGPSSNTFRSDELGRLRAWLESAIDGKGAERTDETYLDAITLLPRVLALSDSSLPIIIFSSLGQATIVDRFSDFPNVVTGFEKPALTDYEGEDVQTRTRQTFWSAIDRALSLCESVQDLRGRV